MNKKITRKSFLKKASVLTLGFAGFSSYLLSSSANALNKISSKLMKDPNGIIDLPDGFKYKIISQFNESGILSIQDEIKISNSFPSLLIFP